MTRTVLRHGCSFTRTRDASDQGLLWFVTWRHPFEIRLASSFPRSNFLTELRGA
jgi:hypothetical protein